MAFEKTFLEPHQLDGKFRELCGILKPTVIGDVGSRDCEDAIALKAASPMSEVFAFEANPENFFDFCCDPKVLQAGVQPQHLAISDSIGKATINIPAYASSRRGGNLQQRGTSSLLKRALTSEFVCYDVPQTTLDAFFASRLEAGGDLTFAFWIDVEGLAREVLSGMPRCLQRTLLLKIELEDKEFYENQSLSGEARKILSEHGFFEAFQTGTAEMFDIVFVKGRL